MPRRRQRTPVDHLTAPGYAPPAPPAPDIDPATLPDPAPIYRAAVRLRLSGRLPARRAPHAVALWRELARQLGTGRDPEACLVVLIDALMPSCSTLTARLRWYDSASADYLAALTSPTACARLSTRAGPERLAAPAPQ